MGSRPNSYLGYGIAWEESEVEVDVYDILDKLDDHPKFGAELWACESVPCLFIYVRGTFSQGDWDSITAVDVKSLICNIKHDTALKKLCKKFELEYKDPQVLLLSYYG